MAKVKCKGTKLQHTVSAALADIAQIESFSHSGAASETVEVRTLDASDAFIEHLLTGYSEGGEISAELLFDPALAGHQAITDRITTPASNAQKIIFADTGVTEWPFSTTGVGFDVTVDGADMLKASVTFKVTGAAGFAT